MAGYVSVSSVRFAYIAFRKFPAVCCAVMRTCRMLVAAVDLPVSVLCILCIAFRRDCSLRWLCLGVSGGWLGTFGCLVFVVLVPV